MTKITCSLFLLCLSVCTIGQQKKAANAAAETAGKIISLQPENWDFKPNMVEFTTYKSRTAMKILPKAGKAVLKMMDFTDGTIEFDFDPLDPFFASFYFHYQDANENECFYFRTQSAGNTNAIDAIQYAPHIAGINLWDMLFHYQGGADFKRDQWNHVKLVISGRQMRAYVNSNTKPTLEIPRLEGNALHGTLAFEGEAAISNLVVKPGQIEGLDSRPGIDLTDHDPRYIRTWEVSTPLNTPPKIDFNWAWVPDSTTKWEPIEAERRGLINLTRKFGQGNSRRIVWLKKSIQVATAQTMKLHLGFSDEVWVLLNGRPLYFDKNWYGTPLSKEPAGRCTIENASVLIPLKAGDNQVLIGVANNFYGWGIITRMDVMAGNN